MKQRNGQHLFDKRYLADEYIQRRRQWLDDLGILDKGWVILGAAPDPILPDELLRTHARVDINNAGKAAQARGLGRAALTIRSHKKSWDEHNTVDTEAMIWMRNRQGIFPRRYLIGKPYTYIGKLSILTKQDRNALVTYVSGVKPQDAGDFGKVTNGVVGACYGLMMGVPEVVLAGISLTKTGHAYDSLNRHRLQVEEDTYVLRELAKRCPIYTTEPDVCEVAGIPMWTNEDTARP